MKNFELKIKRKLDPVSNKVYAFAEDFDTYRNVITPKYLEIFKADFRKEGKEKDGTLATKHFRIPEMAREILGDDINSFTCSFEWHGIRFLNVYVALEVDVDYYLPAQLADIAQENLDGKTLDITKIISMEDAGFRKANKEDRDLTGLDSSFVKVIKQPM